MEYKNKIVLITGGTGSFGLALLESLLLTEVAEVRILSRDENKQHELRENYRDERVKCYIGDVRIVDSIKDSFQGVDYIFHAAALKQVPSCEFFPIEAVRTNILGTENVLSCAAENCVESVVFLSTDKAVYPINAMGLSKALMEKVVGGYYHTRSKNSKTRAIITRYGNVIGSRGSVIPKFINQLKSGSDITLTEPNMTRFLMSLDEAIDLVHFAFDNGGSGDILIQKAPAAKIADIANAVKILCGKNLDYPSKILGARHGEKMHEVLIGSEEISRSIELGNYIKIFPDERELDYESYFYNSNSSNSLGNVICYDSSNADQLNYNEIIDFLKKDKHIQAIM